MNPSEAVEQQLRVSGYFSGGRGSRRYESLTRYADWHLTRVLLSRRLDVPRLNGQTGRDMVHTVVLTATATDPAGRLRRRIPANIPLTAALRRIVRSHISHCLERSENTARLDRFTHTFSGERIDSMETYIPFWEPEGDRLSHEARMRAREESERFLDFVRPDWVVHGMLVLVRDEDLEKPAKLVAARLGVSVTEIYNARKRLSTWSAKFPRSAGTSDADGFYHGDGRFGAVAATADDSAFLEI